MTPFSPVSSRVFPRTAAEILEQVKIYNFVVFSCPNRSPLSVERPYPQEISSTLVVARVL